MSDTYDSSRHRDTTDETSSTDAAAREDTTHGSTVHGSTVHGSTEPGDDVRAADDSTAGTVLHEEHLTTGTESVDAGSVHVRKHVETHPVEYSVPRDVEQVDTSERIAVDESDSGEVEVLDDGSVSIPVFEEVLVVTKRLVVRERVIVRKHTVVDEYKLQTELRREHVSVDADDSIDVVDNRPGTPGPGAAE